MYEHKYISSEYVPPVNRQEWSPNFLICNWICDLSLEDADERERERLESEICVWSPMTEEAVRPRAFERYSSAITAYRGWSCDRAEGKERASEEMESLRDADVTLDLGEQTCVLTNVSRDNLQPSVSLSLSLSLFSTLCRSPSPSVAFRRAVDSDTAVR